MALFISVFVFIPREETLIASEFEVDLKIEANSPFNITSNADFSLYSNGSGNGAKDTPWIIENYMIDGSGTGKHGILIANTTDYFILRNCSITNVDGSYEGLYLMDLNTLRLAFVVAPLLYFAVRLLQAVITALIATPLLRNLKSAGFSLA